ncbi:MAG: hypothetical protein ACLSCQ_06460 [Evtepia gabavorous]
MRPIPPAPAPGQRILLIPAMLDAHFPLLQYAFHSKAYYPVILSQSRGLADLGLRYAHNDLCYPFVLSLGQYLQALGSGAYDLDQVSLLMPSAGDACRGSNFPSLIRKALAAAGYPQVEVLTWNVKGLERDHALPLRPEMVWRALFGLFYGDLLLLLTLQTRPYEAVAGAANACRDRWTNQLAGELRSGAPLTLRRMKEVFHQAAGDFAALPRRPVARKRVALVGELYTKYCALGNWDILPFLEEAGCEVAVNGFSWYILYYISSQIAGTTGPVQALWRGLGAWMAGLQRTMTAALAAHGFHSLPPFPPFSGRRRTGSAKPCGWLTDGSSGPSAPPTSMPAVTGFWPCSPLAVCPTMCAAGDSTRPSCAGWAGAKWSVWTWTPACPACWCTTGSSSCWRARDEGKPSPNRKGSERVLCCLYNLYWSKDTAYVWGLGQRSRWAASQSDFFTYTR